MLKQCYPFPHRIEYLVPFSHYTVVVNDCFIGSLDPLVLDPYTAIIRGTHQPPTHAEMGLPPGAATFTDQALPPGETAASFVINLTAPKGQAFDPSVDPEVKWRRPPFVVFRLLDAPVSGKKHVRPAVYFQQTLEMFTRPKPASQGDSASEVAEPNED